MASSRRPTTDFDDAEACSEGTVANETHTPVYRPFFRDYPGEPVPER